jgi:hypothetical protein
MAELSHWSRGSRSSRCLERAPRVTSMEAGRHHTEVALECSPVASSSAGRPSRRPQLEIDRCANRSVRRAGVMTKNSFSGRPRASIPRRPERFAGDRWRRPARTSPVCSRSWRPSGAVGGSRTNSRHRLRLVRQHWPITTRTGPTCRSAAMPRRASRRTTERRRSRRTSASRRTAPPLFEGRVTVERVFGHHRMPRTFSADRGGLVIRTPASAALVAIRPRSTSKAIP